MGDITNVVKRYVPSSYRAMITRATVNGSDYTIDDLQALAEYVQYKLLATIAGATEEASVYNPLVLEFLGKVTTVKFIPAAIDFWMDQQEQINVKGSDESESFPARITHLREVYEELTADIAQEASEVGIIDRKLAAALPLVSYGDGGRGILRTPDPDCEPQPGDRFGRSWWSLP